MYASLRRKLKQQLCRRHSFIFAYSQMMKLYGFLDVPTAKGSLAIDHVDAIKVMKDNRSLLRSMDTWIDENALSRSPFHYGLLDFHREAINEIPFDMNLTDIICCLASNTADLSYLEIGVSIGRNLWQVLHTCKNSSLIGYDMDNLYPVIRNRLCSVSLEVIETSHVSVRTDPPQKECFTHSKTGNTITMISGDEFDKDLWNLMSEHKFNLVFSDAMHVPEALHYEWGRLRSLDLLDRNGFTMLWDDLSSRDLRRTFEIICQDACRTFGISPKQCTLLQVPGWIGTQEPPHPVGIISTNGFVSA